MISAVSLDPAALFSGDAVAASLRTLDRAGRLTVLVPELAEARGCAQPGEHAYDVFNHLLACVEAMETLLANQPPAAEGRWFWETVWQWLGPVQPAGPWRDQLFSADPHPWPRRALLLLTALLHDVAKPATKGWRGDGRMHFFGHSELGAQMAATIALRFGIGSEGQGYLSTLITHHLRPGQLGRRGAPPSDRAVLRFFADLEPWSFDLMLLNLADHAAARGAHIDQQQWRRHAAYLRYLCERRAALATPEPARERLVDGDIVMRELSLPPGKRLGQLLRHVEAAEQAGTVQTREQALALARQFLLEPGEHGESAR